VPIREDGKEIEYHVETDDKGFAKKLGEGASSEVYIIKDVKGREPGKIFDESGGVLKIVKDSATFGTAREQVVRMEGAYENLKAAHARNSAIQYADMLEFHPGASEPYMIQRRLDIGRLNDGKKFVQIDVGTLVNPKIRIKGASPALPYEQVARAFPRAYQEALLKLYADLAREGLVSPDLSLPNVYFTSGGGSAGILDIDHIVPLALKRPASTDKTWGWLGSISSSLRSTMPSATVDRRFPSDAETFMEKVLELPTGGNRLNNYIELNGRTLEFQPVLLDPSLVPKYFKNFRLKIEEPKAKKDVRARPWLPWFATAKEMVAAFLIGPAALRPAAAF